MLNSINMKSTDTENFSQSNFKTDFPCQKCGKMLHFDPYDEFEGDETYYIPKNDGEGGELIVCKPCGDKLGYKDHYP